MLSAALAAQEAGQAIAAGCDQFCLASLDDLPDAGCCLHGQRIGPAEEGHVRHAFQRPRQQIDHQRVAQIEARGC